MHSALVANHRGLLNQKNVVVCVGNGFIRSETCDYHRNSLNGTMERTAPAATTGRYKRYADEELDKRITNPQIEGNVLLMDIDNVPRIVTLPQSVMEAYNEGALTINTIANRILARTDQMSRFGAQTQPFYVLVDNEGNPLTRSYSYDEDVDKFVQFLETGLKAYHK